MQKYKYLERTFNFVIIAALTAVPTFAAADMWTISDEDWCHLERADDNRLTLITCIANPSKRLCVQAVSV